MNIKNKVLVAMATMCALVGGVGGPSEVSPKVGHPTEERGSDIALTIKSLIPYSSDLVVKYEFGSKPIDIFLNGFDIKRFESLNTQQKNALLLMASFYGVDQFGLQDPNSDVLRTLMQVYESLKEADPCKILQGVLGSFDSEPPVELKRKVENFVGLLTHYERKTSDELEGILKSGFEVYNPAFQGLDYRLAEMRVICVVYSARSDHNTASLDRAIDVYDNILRAFNLMPKAKRDEYIKTRINP